MLTTELSWPPQYKIKKHKRARNVNIRTAIQGGLEITVPYRFNLQEIPAIIEQHKKWIVKQLLLVATKNSFSLPTQIVINVLQTAWNIYYLESATKLKIIERPQHEIVLMGKIQDKKLCKEHLIRWLKKQAKIVLPECLQKVSQAINISYKKTTIRDQVTLWGSCTKDKAISLNYKLIFLPPHVVRHILIHELCHTIYLNHSARFWNLVEKHDPEWREHKSILRKANQFVPAWI